MDPSHLAPQQQGNSMPTKVAVGLCSAVPFQDLDLCPVLPWEKHPERAFCALGQSSGRGASKGISSSRLTLQGSASGRAQTLILEIVFIQWFIQDNCRGDKSTPFPEAPWSQSFVLNSDRTELFPLKLSKGEGKAQRITVYLDLWDFGSGWGFVAVVWLSPERRLLVL